MTEFIRSYGPAMRSNIARTCPSSRVPLRATEGTRPGLLAAADVALELREEVHQRRLLLLVHLGVRGHGRGGVLERAQDAGLGQLAGDVGELGSRPVVAVVADLVARETAGLRGDELARLVLLGDLDLDLVRRAGRRAEVGQVAHGQ